MQFGLAVFILMGVCFLRTSPVCADSNQEIEIINSNNMGFILNSLFSILRVLVVQSPHPVTAAFLLQSVFPFTDVVGATIIGKGSNLCLDVTSGSTADAAGIEIYSCVGSNNQKWDIKFTGDVVQIGSERYPIFSIVSRSSGKCLCTNGQGTENNVEVIQYTCLSPLAKNQLWYGRWVKDDPDSIEFINHYSGRCLTVYGDVTTLGTKTVIYDCTGRPNAVWNATTNL